MHHRTAVTLALLACATRAAAQIPGAPILQNAWASPGVVAAVNFAGGSDAWIYGAAVALATSSARLQLSGGIGVRSGTGSGSRTNSVYGLRLAVPFGDQTGAFGIAALAGVGAGASVWESPADSVANTPIFPIGAAIGWRHALGATRGFSVYATPSYTFFTGESGGNGLVRVSLGVDVGLSKAIGITAGAEFGQGRRRADGGPSGALYGFGLSYAIGRR